MSAKKELQKAWNQYEDFVLAIAQKEFNRVIKPWLIKNGYSFLAGNGGFVVIEIINNKTRYLHSEDLPKHIQDILLQEIPGMDGNDLGSIMPDYDTR